MSKKKSSKKFFNYKKLFFFFLIDLLIILIIALAWYFVYKRSSILAYDSSLDGSEIAEQEQNTIPKDVQRKIDQTRLLESSQSTQVLGINIQKTPFPVPVAIHVPILMYHYVEYVKDKGDTKRISLNTTPYTLAQEIKDLSDAGYTFMTNKELTYALDGKIKLPSKPILLTFDDGYRDFYTDAYPILKKYHAKATEYVIAGFLDRPNHLLTSQLEQIAKDGLVEIGAHTVNHIWLKGQRAKAVVEEVVQGKAIIEQIIHQPVVSFAYPFGAFDQQALEIVKNSGFASATSTIPGIDQKDENRYFLYRLRPGGRIGVNFLSWLNSQKPS